MKKLLLGTLLVTFSVMISAQVGIGTGTPDSSAILDLAATNKGLLLTRVALTGTDDVTTIPSPKAGLIILNTANAAIGTSTEVETNQIYGYDGTQWVKLVNEKTLSEELGDIKIPQLGGYAYYGGSQAMIELSGNINEINFTSGSDTEELFSEGILKRVSSSNSRFEVMTAGNYVFSGFLNWLMSGVPAGSPTYWTAGVQKSSDGGSTWSYMTGIRCPYLEEYRGLTVPCNYSGVGVLAVGDIIRFTAQRRNGSIPTLVSVTASTPLGIPYSAGFNATVYTN